MFTNVLFRIRGGLARQLVKQHIADRLRTSEANVVMLKELGVTRYWPSVDDGTVLSVHFSGERHADFVKPNRRGASHPKPGTQWASRFAAQVGYESPSIIISRAFNIPLSLSTGKGDFKGWSALGVPLQECGFLYLGEDGPYAMWVPDVPGEVAAALAKGYDVNEPARSFKLEFEGCKRMEPEEWDILVAQDSLRRKQQDRALAA